MSSNASTESLRIAVVDDVADVADALTEMLRMEGLDVRSAHGGEAAIDLIKTFEPHCVLFDISMPGVDGLELARRLRAAHGDDLVLVAMTGQDPKEARVADTFALVDHYFQKPVQRRDLLRLLRPRITRGG
jgi:DNA-binding response OmpR family regulator